MDTIKESRNLSHQIQLRDLRRPLDPLSQFSISNI